MIRPLAAAHSPDTARVGAEILATGGTASDAAAAMTLAACVTEPLVVSLLSGMHAICVTPAGEVRAVDGFVDVPAAAGAGRTARTEVVFVDTAVPYTIGPATFGTPALVSGCHLLNRRFGRLPWAQLVGPARRAADDGIVLTAQDAALLAMLEPVMTLGVGATVFQRPDGTLKGESDLVRLPGIDTVLDALAADPAALQRGPLADELAALVADAGGSATAEDLAATHAVEHTPPAVRVDDVEVRTRRGLSTVSDILARLAADRRDGCDVVRLARASRPGPPRATGTTSLAAVDAEGGMCAVTASLGLGTGDWFHGSHLNSMLGEADLQRGPLRPRTRMGSMMAPTVLSDAAGPLAVLGSAGGSRIPSAVTRVALAMIHGLDPVAAVDLPRIHRIDRLVHAEPHLADASVAALEADGFDVERWADRNHFFGGVSVAGRDGAEGDPRRGGSVLGPEDMA